MAKKKTIEEQVIETIDAMIDGPQLSSEQPISEPLPPVGIVDEKPFSGIHPWNLPPCKDCDV